MLFQAVELRKGDPDRTDVRIFDDPLLDRPKWKHKRHWATLQLKSDWKATHLNTQVTGYRDSSQFPTSHFQPFGLGVSLTRSMEIFGVFTKPQIRKLNFALTAPRALE
ncbi:uncharacterized protein EI90DRAFT_3290610 [Cantharellus anzutake]|uniref:uncharacterized protein n=1 Tax=Cantharellus anzutake TaxID=1750568 RepID=UPI0019036F1C|nr:uncharacterized protein EI90DRAFT_3290610 [Cantharellus anzutake]KAF8328458.1 hypothetical protein EI90DRAFT_3290610 [Cantharellus anzutake]